MLYTEESRIGALAVHIVGNKAKDEPLMVSPSLSDQLSDAALMQTLLAYFMGGFKSEEYFNLYHDTDLTCNDVWNFTCKIFDDGMVREGEALAALHKNIVVKLPCTADGIRAVKYFAGKNIRTNCTLVFSVGQALLAAKAGATYVSPFVGRLDDICENGVALVAEIVRMYRYYGYDTQVLAASIRHTQHIVQCVEAGADVATCPLAAIKGLLKHPLTDIGLAQFLADHAKVNS